MASYHVTTFGCQMNEHDSERIAGLLEADGLVLADSEADADVIVVNTCCIREGADTKTYGNLGHLKSWKDQLEGRQLVVAGCMAQKDRETVRQRAPWVDVVLGRKALAQREVVLALGDGLHLEHPLQHRVAPRRGGLWVLHRVVHRGRRDHPREQCGLVRRHVDRLAQAGLAVGRIDHVVGGRNHQARVFHVRLVGANVHDPVDDAGGVALVGGDAGG